MSTKAKIAVVNFFIVHLLVGGKPPKIVLLAVNGVWEPLLSYLAAGLQMGVSYLCTD
jgi:hypothetical protein